MVAERMRTWWREFVQIEIRVKSPGGLGGHVEGPVLWQADAVETLLMTASSEPTAMRVFEAAVPRAGYIGSGEREGPSVRYPRAVYDRPARGAVVEQPIRLGPGFVHGA